jgi:hypothetical protein
MFRMRAYLTAKLSDIKKPVGLQVLRAGTTRQQDSAGYLCFLRRSKGGGEHPV